MCSLTFDQDKMYIFVFSVNDWFSVKENLENFINAFMFQVYFVKIS